MRNLDANARVEYREFPVPDTLRRQVAGVWLLRDEGGTTRVQTIYPDGYCEAVVRALDDGGDALCDVAADHGFADQAHAARELRRVTGLAPSRLRAALRADRDGDASVRLAAAFVRGTSRPKPAP